MESRNKEITKEEGEPDWLDLPLDLVRAIEFKYILSNVGTKDFNYAFAADVCPLLIYKEPQDNKAIHYYSPAFNKIFRVACPYDLSCTSIHLTSNGWLLVSPGEYKYSLINPFTGSMHKLPDIMHESYSRSVCAFSSPPPPSPSTKLPDNFMIFGIYCIVMIVSITLYIDGNWSEEMRFENEYKFQLSDCTPIYRNGLFYCMSMIGNIATYDPIEEDWTCLYEPRAIMDIDEVDECYFFELKGELVSFFLKRKRIIMFRLNEEVMAWERIRNCNLDGNEALFLGCPTSSLSRVWEDRMSNKVFFAKVLDVMESIDAQVKEIEGRFFFVPKNHCTNCVDEDDGDGNLGGVCCRSLEDKTIYDFEMSKWWTGSMWYNPMYF